jgi:hypothetical protein
VEVALDRMENATTVDGARSTAVHRSRSPGDVHDDLLRFKLLYRDLHWRPQNRPNCLLGKYQNCVLQ